ncbi:Ribonuclease, partial [Fasciola gigantica]
ALHKQRQFPSKDTTNDLDPPVASHDPDVIVEGTDVSKSLSKCYDHVYSENLKNSIGKRELNSKFDFFNLLNETAFNSPCMIGIDEAGRGPVLDSKQITEQKREQLLSDMLSNTGWIVGGVHVISPVFISEKMLDRCKTSLNTISHDAAIGLIRAALNAGINLSEVDPLTKSYLESCLDPIFGFPSIVRASWSTATTLIDRHGVKITWEDDENPEKAAEAKRLARKRDLAKGTCQLSNFFSPSSKPNEKDKRTTIRQPYFSRAGLVHVDALI